MDKSIRAPGYDLFKLIVALLLLLLFWFLVWGGNSQFSPSIAPTPVGTSVSIPTVAARSTPSPENAATVPMISPSPTLLPRAYPTASSRPSATSTSVLAVTNTPQNESTIVSGTPPVANICDPATSRSRLQVNGNAVILRRLNFRSSPGIQNNWILTNKPDTKVEVVGGPVCLPYFVGAYVWWQIKLPDGRIGWSAESSLRGKFYFMEPSP